jgi:hypothetical protein
MTAQGQEDNEALKEAAQSDKSAARLQAKQEDVSKAIVETPGKIEQGSHTVARDVKETLKNSSTAAKIVGGTLIVVGAAIVQPEAVAAGIWIWNASTTVDAVSTAVSGVDAYGLGGSKDEFFQDLGGLAIDKTVGLGASSAGAAIMKTADGQFLPVGVKQAGETIGLGLGEVAGATYDNIVDKKK